MQLRRVRVETLRHARGFEVGERANRVQTQTTTGRREILSPEHVEWLRSAKALGQSHANHHAGARGQFAAEESVGNAEERLFSHDVAHGLAHGLEHGLLPAKEPTRPTYG